MKKLNYILILLVCISCSTKTPKVLTEIKLGYIELTNEILLKNIENYCNDNLKEVNFEFVIVIELTQRNDTSLLELYYDRNIFSLIKDPPTYYTTMNDKIIFIKAQAELFYSKSKEDMNLLLRKTLKKQYAYFIDNNFVPPPDSYRVEIRRYINDVLMDSRIE